ncbi:MAG: sugar ABC transporter permease [Thermoflexales bacterium]|nr:sugar ABC transporter permease [Thermoflexales bacterium]MCS7323729.1 sugar ABC transporter permease [Thermoflexales bacterium]MCX7938624.1 sugar ABC transporter permease [Thermoflexales bacterium]MDW8054512.1 sugar ABC transporter permease [Anaerolineae bacterium]MDW8292869.1 sugar ABC transporter permease [Anaerolineae bacterium]
MAIARPALATSALRRRAVQRDRLIAVLMLVPSILAIAVFVYGFIAYTAYVSMSNYTTARIDLSFVGLDHYVRLFGERRFQENIRNLIVFTLFFLAVCLVFGLALALMVDAHVKGESVFRAIYLFPMAISFIVTGVAWRWLFTPGDLEPTGINLLFEMVGLGFLKARWIADTSVWPNLEVPWLKVRLMVPMAIIPVVVAAVWQMSGFAMAMFLAGLRGIPEEIKEAARVDGCSEWQMLRHIILPMLRPVTLSAIVVLTHVSLKTFDLIMTMTGGGPGNKTELPSLYMYELRFSQFNTAQAAAVAMILLILVSLLTVPYLVYNRRAQSVEQ